MPAPVNDAAHAYRTGRARNDPMRIEEVTAKPCQAAVEPTIVLEAKVVVRSGQEVPILAGATILNGEGMILGSCHGVGDARRAIPLDAEAQASQSDIACQIEMRWVLTSRVLDRIQTMRHSDKKGDVRLTCRIRTVTMRARVYNTPFKLGVATNIPQGPNRSPVFYEAPGHLPYHTDVGNLWVLSGANGKTFLEQETAQQDVGVSIRSSDWVHDFESVFKSTRYLVVELAIPEQGMANASLPTEKLNAALAATRRASDSLDKGEWSDVIADLRPVWELVRNDNDLQNLLRRDGYPEDAVSALNESVKAQFNLASKFVHRLSADKKTVMPEIKASREDALLCYSFSMAVLNLMTRKASRLARSDP